MRITIATAVLLTLATPAFASQNGTLYGSCGNPGVHCGHYVADSTAGRETCAGGAGRCLVGRAR
jgi:hypothetical protein